MKIVAYEKMSMLDYPGKLVSIVFTPGCVFRCPFCHNPELVDGTHPDARELWKNNREKEFFIFLEKRKGKLDGVCITGGEPTLQGDLLEFIQRVKDMGFLVKLDTNGLFPDRVAKILDSNLIDYWAMDIKHTKEKYHLATGVPIDIKCIEKSASLIMSQAKAYELRTTVVPGIHAEEDFDAIANWIDGAEVYYLQEFRDIKILDPQVAALASQNLIGLNAIGKKIGGRFKKFEIRR